MVIVPAPRNCNHRRFLNTSSPASLCYQRSAQGHNLVKPLVKHTLGKKDNTAAMNMTLGVDSCNFLGHMVVDTYSTKKNSNEQKKSASNSPPLNSYLPFT